MEIAFAGFVIRTWLDAKIVGGLPAEVPLYFYKHLSFPLKTKDFSSNPVSIFYEHQILSLHLSKIHAILVA